MKRKKHTPQQIITKLRDAGAMLGTGLKIPEVCRRLEISEQTFHRWRNQYGGMKAQEVKRLKGLEVENGRLKKMVAERDLDIEILKEASSGNW
jgi:putative transposase